jgi:hypothetical protein
MSQADDIKPESETQDATMEDAPSPPASAPAPAPAEKSNVNLEELFDDDSDGEFASSVPVKSEEEASQPAPLYAMLPLHATTSTYWTTARSLADPPSPILRSCVHSTNVSFPSATFSNG